MGKLDDNWGRTQGARARSTSVSAAVSAEERAQIRSALRQAGFPGQSAGMRSVLLAYVGDAAVRDAVSGALSDRMAA